MSYARSPRLVDSMTVGTSTAASCVMCNSLSCTSPYRADRDRATDRVALRLQLHGRGHARSPGPSRPISPPDELWALVGDGDGLGRVAGRRRRRRRRARARPARWSTTARRVTVRIDHVDPHERVAFTWWPQATARPRLDGRARRRCPGRQLLSHRDVTARRRRRRPPSAWDVRALLLGSLALARPRVTRRAAGRSTSCSPSSPTRPGGPCSSGSSTTARRRRRRSPSTSRRPARRSSSTCRCSPTPGSSSPERDGREVRYVATTERLADAVTWLLDASRRWDRRLARLRARR